MSTTTMHFGPEWMRAKQHPTVKAQNPPSPPLSHSSLPSMSSVPYEKRDEHNLFRYTKEEMLRIFRESGHKGSLGLEVERWEGVVREGASEPVSLREMDEAEKKLFAGSINSGPRRRPSGDYLAPLSTSTDRPRLSYSSSIAGTPLRERFGPLRRRDSTDSPTSAAPLPRKQSIPSLQSAGISSSRDVGLPSPRSRVGITANFDGGDSWTTHRRASEVSLKSAIAMSREASSDLQNDIRGSDIREEQESQVGFSGEIKTVLDRGSGGLSTYQAEYVAGQNSGSTQTDLHNADSRANHLENVVDYGPSDRAPSGPPPPPFQDLASVEWSYKDPTGQVQGPFRADLMQKWFDEGYFSLDLPTKRTHLDSHWITVEALLRRASDDKIFLSVPAPPAPPGLMRRTDSPQSYSGTTEQDALASLSHPSPVRTLRNSTLDNYVTIGSNSSESPSSFGGAQFSNGSPDLIGLGGRTANPLYYMGPSVNGRVANLSNVVDSSFVARRATLSDAALDPALVRSQAYPNITLNRTASTGEYGLNGIYNPGSYPILDSVASSRNAEPLPLNAYSQSPGLEPMINYRNGHDGGFHDNVLSHSTFGQPDYGTTHSGRLGLVNEETSPLNHYNAFGGVANNAVHGQPQFGQASSPFLSHTNARPNNIDPLDSHPAANIDSSEDAQVESESSIQSPWQEKPDVSVPRRDAPLDASHPPASATITHRPPASLASPWGNKMELSQQHIHVKDVSPWTSQAASDGWKGDAQHDKLTFSNIVQHNQQYLSNDVQAVRTSIPDSPNPQQEQIDVIHTSPIENGSAASNGSVQLTRGKVVSQLDQDERPDGTSVVTPDSSGNIDSPAEAPAPKIAWLKEPGPSISLRDIQEAEVKKVEARKAAERVSRTNSVPAESKEDVQPFTTSWGLPSSQAGSRSAAPLKEPTQAPSPSVPTPPAPVWTNAMKSSSTKKSMKEIQEEEERRKRLLVTKEPTLAAAAARKVPLELANKASSNQGGAWTMVGHNGKPTTPVAISAKPPPTTAGSAVVSTPRVNGPARPAAPPVLAKAPSSNPRIDEIPPAPSHDFLRWLTDSLKGLNNSVNVEEIMSMLLSFPLDPDPSTVELISDLIYTNSTTLDGRRFASEFISKRKSDAATRAKNAGSSGKSPAKPVSIADVVKAAPKPTQSEWSFKVVNKKKKGGRT